MNQWKNFTKGILKENPLLVLILGTCPALATTSSAINGMSMGLATTFVIVMSNIAISLIKNVIPDKIRIPAYIVVIASFVTVVQLLMEAYMPALYDSLGLFIPLIVVNCIVLGRAEAFASKNTVFSSMIDGFGMGIGFTFALTLLGFIRELLGNFSVFGNKFIQADGILVFVLAPGAFFGLAFLIALINKINAKK